MIYEFAIDPKIIGKYEFFRFSQVDLPNVSSFQRYFPETVSSQKQKFLFTEKNLLF